MNPILLVRISPSTRPLFLYFHFGLPSLSRSFVRYPRVFMRVYVCERVRAYLSVLEQVRRRLKGRQPDGRRRSKGFRVLPTRTASVVAVHPRAKAGQITRDPGRGGEGVKGDNGTPCARREENAVGGDLVQRGGKESCAGARRLGDRVAGAATARKKTAG